MDPILCPDSLLRRLAFCLIFIGGLTACESTQTPSNTASPSQNTSRNTATADTPIAYLRGQPIRMRELLPSFYEAAGQEVLTNAIVDRLLAEKLKTQNLTITAAEIDRERDILVESLISNLEVSDLNNREQAGTDADKAARVLRQLRQRRALGDVRFNALLQRNASLRKLVATDVQDTIDLSDTATRRLFDEQFGTRYDIRILTTRSVNEATRLRQRALAGEAFTELAINHSTDPTAERGGKLLEPLSPLDTSYPAVLRNVLPTLKPSEITRVIPIDGQFLLAQLVSIIPPNRAANYEQLKPQLQTDIQRRTERILMQRLVRSLLIEAEPVILNPTLARQWRTQQEALINQP